jgi:hypothetical protein
MATSLSLTQTYAGKLAGDLIYSSALALESLPALTVRASVESSLKVRRLVDDVSFASFTCDFTPTGTTTLTERTLTLVELQAQRQYCKKDFLDDWSAAYAQDGQLDPTIQNGIADNFLAQAMEKLETTIWEGTAGAGSFDGFITLALADGDVLDVAGAAAIDASNVFTKLQNLVDTCPDKVKNSTEKPIIYMSQDVWEKFIFANAGAGNGWYTYNGPGVQKQFMGLYQIVVCPGMAANRMLMAKKSNLWFGTWKESQMNQLAILDMTDKDLSDNVRISLKFFGAVQYGFGDEIALYTV